MSAAVDAYLGSGNGAGEENRNVARVASLLADLPAEVPGPTVNRLCGSGMEAARPPGRTGISISGYDAIELNEAFASQAVAVCRERGVDPEDERLNPRGGAIALGQGIAMALERTGEG